MFEKATYGDLEREVIKKGLCTACGTCAGVCPAKDIAMDYARQEALPKLTGTCRECGLCVKVCPGRDVPLKDIDETFLGRARDFINEEIGVYKNCYKGWAADDKIAAGS